ncbi:MAG: GrpB family protein [Capsulimonas sp.]|uniref:GrpB family protein n=1 Tax=Capsulimonas sp. TaxID=2494211 RepID=UPI0032675FAE
MSIEIIPYADRWPSEFQLIATPLRDRLGDLALRIDHIGSTAVCGLPAKDVIDVQVTVRSQDSEDRIVDSICALGYVHLEHIRGDHLPLGMDTTSERWVKLFFLTPQGQRRVNLHVRVAGNPNQRYALLFRDYLRANPIAAEGYAEIKRQLARYHPDDEDAYYDVKDPVCDIIMAGAEVWAAINAWRLGSSDA